MVQVMNFKFFKGDKTPTLCFTPVSFEPSNVEIYMFLSKIFKPPSLLCRVGGLIRIPLADQSLFPASPMATGRFAARTAGWPWREATKNMLEN